MYLTAQRVTKDSDGDTGINAFLHRHDTKLKVDSTWGVSDLSKIANHNPGALVSKKTVIQPGGNRVLSYLDIVCEDSESFAELKNALSKYRQKISTESFPIFENTGRIAVLFWTSQRLHGMEIREFQSLANAALSLLESFCLEEAV